MRRRITAARRNRTQAKRVALRFRTAKDDVDRVFYIEEDKNVQAEMRKVSSDSLFDYYEYSMEATASRSVTIFRW